MATAEPRPPTVFVSYAHEDKAIAEALSGALTEAGCNVWIDQSDLGVGELMVEAIGTAIASADFLLALISTASLKSLWCQRELSLGLTHEIKGLIGRVLPVRIGEVVMPAVLADKRYVQIRGVDGVPTVVAELVAAIEPPAQPNQPVLAKAQAPRAGEPSPPIKMVAIVKEGVTLPLEDGTPGSSLYRIPIRLSRRPDARWAQLLVALWDSPSSFSLMHRPGIASVVWDTIVLDGTTIDELERVHMATLRWAVDEANTRWFAAVAAARVSREQEEQRRAEHAAQVEDADRRIDFGSGPEASDGSAPETP